ncbi:MAG: hypothetical protein VX733_12865 [Candidatus Latescibacterota bacterium]|nr:hypothetical protein [Candidatus Latescibacterota bacterium]
MSTATLFDPRYEKRKNDLLLQVVERLRPVYTTEEVSALRIDPVNPAILSQLSGRGFVNRDILETVLGNLLECVAPGSHNAVDASGPAADLLSLISELSDQLYAMVAQSLLATGEDENLEDRAVAATYGLLFDLPRLKERALWNRFASLKDPAVWDAYLRHACGIDDESLMELEFASCIDTAIGEREQSHYREFLRPLQCDFVFDYQMQLVMSTYPGWRVLFYHDVANALSQSDEGRELPRLPVPLLPRAISELAGRYYQADIHPETSIGDANFLDHPHRGLTTGQTGIIGSGCHILPCTLGGLTRRLRRRHPVIGDYVFIGTDADIFGPVQIGDHSIIGPSAEIYGFVNIGRNCRVNASVVIGTVKAGETKPGKIVLGEGVSVGDGTIIENRLETDLLISDRSQIPARSLVVNDGYGKPKFVGS